MTPVITKNKNIFLALLRYKYDITLTILIGEALDIDPNLTITEGYRSKLHPHDVHSTDPVRAIDGGIKEVKDPQALVDRINRHWIYDRDRGGMKCALYHARCSVCGSDHQTDDHTGVIAKLCRKCGNDITNEWHIHFQVHPNTVCK